MIQDYDVLRIRKFEEQINEFSLFTCAIDSSEGSSVVRITVLLFFSRIFVIALAKHFEALIILALCWLQSYPGYC